MALWKVEANADKQTIQPGRWTFVRIGGVRFMPKVKGRQLWEWIVQCEFPDAGAPSRVRWRLVRYPNTQKADSTGHTTWNVRGFAGASEHFSGAHSILMDAAMPIGLWVWHDGTKPIKLDGRQIKNSPMA